MSTLLDTNFNQRSNFFFSLTRKSIGVVNLILSPTIKYYLIHNKASRRFFSLLPETLMWQIDPITKIQIELSSHCNLKCPFCTQVTTTRAMSHLSLAQFDEIVKKLPNTINSVTLHFSGESFLNPDLPAIVAKLSAVGIRTQVSSNGTLPFKRYKAAIDSGLSNLIITIDGIKKEHHEKHRVGSKLEKVMYTLKQICEIRNKSTKITVQTIVTKENEQYLGKLISMCKEYGVDRVKMKTLSLNCASDEDFQNIREEALELLPESPEYSRYAIKNGRLRLKRPKVICPEPRHPVITAEGDVVLCGVDYERQVIAGNIFQENSFLEIWFSDKYKEIRRKALLQTHKICQLCNYSMLPSKKVQLKPR